MSMRTLGALATAMACALSSPVSAQETAQETNAVSVSASAKTTTSPTRYDGNSPGNLRILAGMHFGGGGEWESDLEGAVPDIEVDLDPHVGIQAGVDYVLMEYFALGGELRLTWWKPENDNVFLGDFGRSLFVDIDVKPRGRYAFHNIPLEVYGTLPMGLTIVSMDGDSDVEYDGGAGFNLGFGGGANYFFTEHFGINAEILGVWHWFNAEIQGTIRDVDTDNKAAQFYFFINGIYAI